MTLSKARNIFVTEITREGFFKRHFTVFTVAHYQTIFFISLCSEKMKRKRDFITLIVVLLVV